MEDPMIGRLFVTALSDEEWEKVPSEIGKKLENFVVDKIDELITAKALSETNKQKAETSLNEVLEKLHTSDSSLSETNLKLENSTRTITELEAQISTCTLEITKLQTSCNRLEADAADFRHQRNLALGERDELAKTLERCTGELERLQMDGSVLTKQLQTAITAKCEALAETNEVASIKLSLEYKEKRLDQERALLSNQVETLTQCLNERTEEFLSIKKDNSLRCIQLENKLMEKTQELAVAMESVRNITDINGNLTNKIEELAEKLKTERDNDAKAHELYQQELESQTKLADLYKSMTEQNKEHADELERAVTELQHFLHEATEKYGDLETKHKESQLANDEVIIKKNECIAMLKQELETSNDMFKALKDESINKEVEGISPSAATASRLIKPGMSLTQIYTQYVTACEELTHEREENRRLNSYIQNIITELEDKGPLLRKQREDYETAIETIKEISQQNNSIMIENQQLKEEALQSKRDENSVSRVNARLKKEVADLSRQVCHLLREVELSRAGVSSSSNSTDHDMSDSMSSGDIITKKLVTFSDIAELQTTNQRLLALVRELSSKQEEAETLDPVVINQLKMKLETMKETQSSLLEQQDGQNKMMGMVVGQRDMYKSLYEQAMKGSGEELQIPLEHPYTDRNSQCSKNNDDSDSHSDDKVQDLINQLEKTKKEIELLKDENDTYRKEKSANEKILIEQMEDMRKELHDVTRQNCKLSSVAEMKDERFKIIQSNVEVYKSQISALEKQNKIYSESIIKHEQMATYLKDETLQSQTKLSKAEVKLGNLEKENALLYDRETRLVKELEFLKKEAHGRTLLQTNIELIKATLERNDAESRIRLEERLDEAHRECAALRRRLQEEQDRFRELGDHLEKQTHAAQSQMEEEKTAAGKLQHELAQTREDLIAKQVQIEELSKKFKTSLLTIPEGSVDGAKFRELERMLNDAQAEVQALQQQLKTAKETAQQHCNVAEGAEKQLNALVGEHDAYRKVVEEKLKERETRILKLEEQCSELRGELSIQSDGPDVPAFDMSSRLHRMEDEFKATNIDLNETKKNLDIAQNEIKQLTKNLEIAENKYTHEMMLHSNDLQMLATVKEELTAALRDIEEVKHAKDQALTALQESKAGLAVQNNFFKTEKEQLQERFKGVDKQNSLLLDQLQAVNTQLSAIQAFATEQNNSLGGGADSSNVSINKSFTEDDIKSSEQLLKIIKYLRQEKDVHVSKCEILEAEHHRLKSQFDMLTKQLEDAKAALDAERQKSDISIVTSAKHAEVLRKVETLNAITDSNRTLRMERDSLVEQIEELKARTSILEEQVAPLQEKNREMSLKSEAMHTENVTLRGEATRWRQRANMLIEKSNRTSPEDWKKLQNERENLAKQLTIERGTSSKLNDELSTLKQDKGKVDEQLRSLRYQHNQLSEELDKTKEELGKTKEQLHTITQELDSIKENYNKLTAEKTKVDGELEAKNETIVDLKNNLLAVRKIAKKYKQQCEDFTKEMETLKQDQEEKSRNESIASERKEQIYTDARSELEDRIVHLEQLHNERVDELNQQVSSASDETDNYKKEIETLKQSSLDKEERFKTLFKNAKERIVSLTEQNASLRSELYGRPSDIHNDTDKTAEVERLSKEKEEILTEKQQEKDRFTSEIETLTQRINQLQRQLGQQNSKPSTSSGSSEKSATEPPTANIKPMAGHSTNIQTQSVQIQPWRSGPETPLASIRPMSMQVRTVAVLPTSQGATTSQGPSAVMVPPQQVHTTGPSNIETLSSSPTSSHTEYMPATSSATPTAVGPRQVAVPPTQSTQDTEDEDNNMQVQPAPQQQAVALVLPRVEQPNNGPAQESGTSSSSSNAVTTTQAGLKRPREADTDSQSEEPGKSQQQTKRTRVQQGTIEALQSHGTVSDSGLDVEYQVPTSSQRDHEEDTDAVIVVESDEDGEGPDEGEGDDDDDGDDPDTEGYDMEEQDLNYDEDMEEEEGGNEVEVVEDSNEVPNQSERCIQEGISQEENSEQPQSEAISSGTDGTSGVTVSQASPSIAVTMPSFSRTRPVAPLSRQQQSHLLLPHGLDEGGDDGIVPSTPTLFPPRRSDGFGEAVSSPHVPTGSRFTYESAPSNPGSTEIIPEQTLEFSHTDDNSTGRSVPSTPLQASPQESGPGGEELISHQTSSSEPDIPTITISGVTEEAESAPEGSLSDCMGPPSTAGTSAEASQPNEQHHEMLENEDGVTSEGEKPPASEESEEEGREAEASPSTNTRSRSNPARNTGVARRSVRNSPMRGGMGRSGPTPIVWNDQHHQSRHQQAHRGRGQQNFPPRVARRSRGRSPRTPYGRF